MMLFYKQRKKHGADEQGYQNVTKISETVLEF
jgi:hypothetical protein